MAVSDPAAAPSEPAVSDRAAASVAEAAAWLARQGVDVTTPSGPTAASARPERLAELSDEVSEKRSDENADPYEVARSIVLRKLSAQDRTRHELAKALRTRNVPDEVAEEVLGRFQEVGLVNDAAFAGAWVESRQQRRHLSRPALRRELQAKGVDRDDIDAALESVEVGDELAAARDLAQRRHQGLRGQSYVVRYRRLAGVLSRRGFGGAIVAQVLREVLAEGDGAGDVLDPDLDRT